VQFWDRWLRSRFGLVVGVVGTVATPVLGVVVLRFLLGGTPVELGPEIPQGNAVSSPVMLQSQPRSDSRSLTVVPFVTSMPTPTHTPMSSPTPTPTLVRQVNATLGLNVRVEPTIRAAVIRVLPFEAEVRLTGQQRTSEGLVWVEVDPEGWVQVRYLDP